MNSYEKVTIRLYFANETGDGLIPINRELLHNIDVSNISMEKLVVEQLIAGPANDAEYLINHSHDTAKVLEDYASAVLHTISTRMERENTRLNRVRVLWRMLHQNKSL